MKLAGKTAAIALAGALTVSACETNEEMGQMLGALAGAGLGLALAGDDDDTMKAIALVAGASLGAWIGGNIGRGLDEQERQRLANSAQQVLAMEVPASSPLRTAPTSTTVAAAPPPADAPTVAWDSPTNPGVVSGKTTLLAVNATANGGECRKMRQAVTRNGQESFEDVQMCKSAGGGWQPMQA
jgi:surface antigen